MELAEAHVAACQPELVSDETVEVFNLGTGKGMSVREMMAYQL